jgi:DNA mismatch repair protein MutS
MTRPMKLTPMLEQYFEIKRQVPDAILFYRLGDFYEMFFEDAQTAAPLLDLVLTARGKGGDAETPMCGVPYHSADQHIAKLVRNGFRVAICEQVEEASQAKGLVRREVVRIVTPGTAIEGMLLGRDHCYLLALVPDGEKIGAAWLDVSTGDFFLTSYSAQALGRIDDDVSRHSPKELIFPSSAAALAARFEPLGLSLTPGEESLFDLRRSREFLANHFGTQSLRGFGLEDDDVRIAAAGGALRYAALNHRKDLTHVRSIRFENDDDTLLLDASTLENLEIFESRDPSRSRASLWGVLHHTKSAMGSRTLRQWLGKPLRQHDSVFARHDAVDELTRDRLLLERLRQTLARIADLERLTSRITLRTATPPDCQALSRSLAAAAEVREIAGELSSPLHLAVRERIDPLAEVVELISRTLVDDPPANVRDGGLIRDGIDAELDELRSIARDSKSILLGIETKERERTGIGSLKIRFNSVFGYYIEISKSNLAKAPPDYIRKQTLVNAERFITPELKELEEKILGAEEKSKAIEVRRYETLLSALSSHGGALLQTARAVGEIDVLSTFATIAVRNRYVRPRLLEEAELAIEEGRHPVIETLTSERFIPNDTAIHRDRNGLQIITGPNMGGKSTYLRQVALIVLMNQVGSFVPAKTAALGLFDRIFTRVGASDNLARGESTFMVEMHETANILNNASPRSLIILDEVGRGTATFDGLSLAWAIIEFLHDRPDRSAITLFATHYHELTDLARSRDRVENCSVAVKEWNDQIIFLRKVVPGAADKSYGIQVAKLAGLPAEVVTRAREILQTLELKERDVVEAMDTAPLAPRAAKPMQLSLFNSKEREVLQELAALQLDAVSPIEALNRLHAWRKQLVES